MRLFENSRASEWDVRGKAREERESCAGNAVADEGTTHSADGLRGLAHGCVRSDRLARSPSARWCFRGIFRSTLGFTSGRFPSRSEEPPGGRRQVATS
jgi:hypothetical protein